jgi:hypothetical protein
MCLMDAAETVSLEADFVKTKLAAGLKAGRTTRTNWFGHRDATGGAGEGVICGSQRVAVQFRIPRVIAGEADRKQAREGTGGTPGIWGRLPPRVATSNASGPGPPEMREIRLSKV